MSTSSMQNILWERATELNSYVKNYLSLYSDPIIIPFYAAWVFLWKGINHFLLYTIFHAIPIL